MDMAMIVHVASSVVVRETAVAAVGAGDGRSRSRSTGGGSRKGSSGGGGDSGSGGCAFTAYSLVVRQGYYASVDADFVGGGSSSDGDCDGMSHTCDTVVVYRRYSEFHSLVTRLKAKHEVSGSKNK
jgi:hypothetical protein